MRATRSTISRLATIIVLAVLFDFPCSASSPAVASNDQSARNGLRLYQQNKFVEAMELLKAARSEKPQDISTLYYLGMSALGANDKALAIEALSGVVVMTLADNQFHQNALIALDRNFKITPYSCMQKNEGAHKGGTVVRWTTESQPLKIFISHGISLPLNCYKGYMNDEELRETASALKQRDFVSSLGTVANYVPEFRQYALEGLKQWDWAKEERFLDYVLTEKVEEADIVLFWSPTLPGVGGVSNLPAAAAQPVIIQISVDNLHNQTNRVDALKSLVAHEFGHAFGLAHTAVPRSIMNTLETITESPGQEYPRVSNNDKVTLRALYNTWPRQATYPGVVLFSVVKRR
jgi:hypothetical protein